MNSQRDHNESPAHGAGLFICELLKAFFYSLT